MDIGWTFNDGNTGSQGTGGAQTGTGTSRVETFNVKINFATSFNANVGTKGLSETFSIFVDAATNPNGYWVQDKRGTWNNIATAIETVEGKTRIDFAITDGGVFNGDGVANGIIRVTGGAGNRPLTLVGQPPDLQPGNFWF